MRGADMGKADNGLESLNRAFERLRRRPYDLLRQQAQRKANETGLPVNISFDNGQPDETVFPDIT